MVVLFNTGTRVAHPATVAAMNHLHIAVLLCVAPCCNVVCGYQSLGASCWKRLHLP
ncbi:hypothetical protein B7P43_G13547 [Cryptotermes secundus]|uniref:Uncharacterized protein n=1 Tax=Cryptotermes secundus TaxID=105785 RepID=A0A2J7PYM1_9NEOP|nr:hypothetical protein B7P43_G13547 [Cryptotermes secundus]